MKKSRLLIFLFLFSIIVASFLFMQNKKKKDAELLAAQEKFDQEMMDKIAGYVSLYEEPAVKMVREVFTAYLNDDWEWLEKNTASASAMVNKGTWDPWTVGLESFDRSYYQSKYIVFNYHEENFDGASPKMFIVDILFVDRPDRLFRMTFAKDSKTYDLIPMFFMAEPVQDPEFIEKFKQDYKIFFEMEKYQL